MADRGMETIEALGKYEIKRPLGRGAMGTVYEGWDPIIARRVAIKTVRLPDASDPETEEGLARFRREAQAAGRLSHPNIVGVFDYGETRQLAYIVMEFVDGPPLKDVLDKHERFVLADIVRIMEDLLSGLQFSHERGVVHRDIKPANVMLTASGQAKIADFGIARIESSLMTQAGTVLGTPAYMSPEQFMGQVGDARSDIYSSGVLLYQLLTGERPFDGGMSAIMHKALNTEPPAPSQLSVTAPASFDPVVRRAMAKRPEDRFSTAKAFIEAVRAAVANPVEAVSEDEATMVAAPASGRVAAVSLLPAASVMQPASRSPVAMIAIAAVVLLGGIGGGAWWFLLRAPVPTHTAAIAVPPVAPAPTPDPAYPPSTAASSAAASSAATPPPPTPPPPPPTAVSPSAPATVAGSTDQVPAGATPAQANQPITATVPPPPAVSPPTAPLSVPVATPAPQAVSPTAHAEQQQLAMAGVDGVRRQVADWAGGQNCALLGGKMGDGGSVDLTGLGGDRPL